MSFCRLAVFVSGSGTNLQALIDAYEAGLLLAKPVLVLSNKKNAYALERAKSHGIAGCYVNQNEEEILQILDEFDIQIIALAGYLAKVPPKVVTKYHGNMINIHPSLIPKYAGKGFYGQKVHEAVLSNRERETGATVHFVDGGIDTGEVLFQEKVAVFPDDTPESLQKRVLAVEHRLLVKGVNFICEKRREKDEGID